MKDWADEIESNIAAAYSSHGAILAADADGMIATALRKAKADEREDLLSFIEGKLEKSAYWGAVETLDVIAEIENGKHREDEA